MGFFNLFDKPEKPVVAPTLENLDVNFIVHYDCKPWIVQSTNVIVFNGEKEITDFVLDSEGESLRFQKIPHQDRWRSYKIVPLDSNFGFDGDIRDVLHNDEPPATLNFEGTLYHNHETGTGEIADIDFWYWEYIDKSDSVFMRFEQYDEHDFSCLQGKEVNPLTIDVIGDSTDEDDD